MRPWIDAHCHLTHLRWAHQLAPVIARSRAAGVGGWVQGGIDPQEWESQRQLCHRFGPDLVQVYGLHPWWVANHDDKEVDEALAALDEQVGGASGLGELGLDLTEAYRSPLQIERQSRAFAAQIALAKVKEKPLILHVVRAHGPALVLLRQHAPYPNRGMVHSFSSGLEVAREYLSLGFLLSIGSSVTREGFKTLKAALPLLPPEALLVETDAPDISGSEPSSLIDVARAVASYTGETHEVVLDRSTKNVRKLLGI